MSDKGLSLNDQEQAANSCEGSVPVAHRKDQDPRRVVMVSRLLKCQYLSTSAAHLSQAHFAYLH
eukprot:4461553-Amphidinium_carterae.1